MNKILNIQKYYQGTLLFLMLTVFFFIGFVPEASANPVCLIGDAAACVGKTPILKTSSNDNAHAGTLLGGSAYTDYLCCSESTSGVTVGTNATGEGLIKLFADDNSHIAAWPFVGPPAYGNNIFISADTGDYVCTTTAPGGNCAGSSSCVAKISIDGTLSNGHIADCGLGNTNYSKVCCAYSNICVPNCSPGSCTDGCGGYCNGNSCNDSNACTSGDTCFSGTCSGAAITCPDDGNSCTDNICAGGACTYPNSASGSLCNDGKNCTSPDKCNGSGTCNGAVNCNTTNFCWKNPGHCDASWNCAYDPKPDNTSCDSDTNDCTYDMCQAGICITGGNACGGLIPCGRLADNPTTGDIDETKACNLCAMFYLLKEIINFIMTLAIGIGVFILIIAGLLYATSAGNPRNVELAKSAITSALIGLAIIFIAWLVIAVILQGLGYANIATWNQINCTLPT